MTITEWVLDSRWKAEGLQLERLRIARGLLLSGFKGIDIITVVNHPAHIEYSAFKKRGDWRKSTCYIPLMKQLRMEV